MGFKSVILTLTFFWISFLIFGQKDVSYSRNISTTSFEKGQEIVVSLKFQNNTFKKDLRLIELLPIGTQVYDIEANYASVDVVNESKLIINWKNIPANSKATVSYKLRAIKEQENNVRLNGAIYSGGRLIFQAKESVLNPTKPVRLLPSK